MGKKWWVLLPVLLGVCFLLGCQKDPAPTGDPTESAPPAKTYTVQYVVLGQTVETETVAEGDYPQDYTPQINGLAFYGWLDEQGSAVTPSNQPIQSDRVYTARIYPDISGHRPYLYTDQYGCLRPDGELTANDLVNALASLAQGEAMKYFPGLPSGDYPVPTDQLKSVLSGLFPPSYLESPLAALTEATVTRGQFATLMNGLLGRGGGEPVTISDGATRPMDLAPERADYLEMLEAAIPHTVDRESGSSLAAGVETLPLPQGLPTGYFFRGGYLYYADEQGRLASNATVGLLTFDENGRYTSGDGELDTIVAGILAEIMEKEPGLTRLEYLRRAFWYCRDSFTYFRRYGYNFGETGWEIDDAKMMFLEKRGNCYNFAASFWALARGLGYDATAISGTMTATDQPHGWVEIPFDGEDYIFDVEMEYVYVHERDVHDKDMFMVTIEDGEWWNYKRP